LGFTLIVSALVILINNYENKSADLVNNDSNNNNIRLKRSLLANGKIKNMPSKKSSRSTRDDANARANYEFNLLKNPYTGKIPDNIRNKELEFSKNIPLKKTSRFLNKKAGANTFEWKNRGPYNVGGRTRALGLDIANPKTILAGGVSGGMWKSTNDGASWTLTTLPTQTYSVSSLVQDTRDGNTETWYYGTGEWRGNSVITQGDFYRGNGIYKSVNNGDSWVLLESTASNTPQVLDKDFDYVWNLPRENNFLFSCFVSNYIFIYSKM